VNTPNGIRRPFFLERNAPARCAPSSAVDVILDPSTWSRWQPEILSASGPAPLSTGDVVRGEASMLGFVVHGHSTALEAGARSFDQDVIVGIRMRVRYDVQPGGGGSLITHRLTADLPRGLWGRVLSLFLRGRLRRLQKNTLRNLVVELEASST
jgi:hypothetical protein